MFYSIQQAESACEEEPSLIFSLIKECDKDVVSKIISKDNYDFSIVDSFGNNVIMALLKNKYYDLVLKYIDKVDINHQNNDGDTIMHLLVVNNYANTKEIMDYILNNKKFIPNIKNNLGETILDKSINSNYLYTTIKILGDQRFNSIDIYSFKNLYETYIKSNNYGKYSKLSNLEIILDNLVDKELLPRMNKLISLIYNNLDSIKNDFYISKTEKIDNLINLVISECLN
ncbi:MAG: hypothetical protein MR266_03090 [Erysipelotrichaceae bacterium]|nr:hypothetical protein [Erysipelotrichaceae bacterium]